MHAVYIDKLDGRIDAEFYEQTTGQWQADLDKVVRDITRHDAADRCYLEEGAQLLDLAHGAQELFGQQHSYQQRRLLNFVLSNSTWMNGELKATFRQPFDLIAKFAQSVSVEERGVGQSMSTHPAWLGFLEDFRTLCIDPTDEFRITIELLGNLSETLQVANWLPTAVAFLMLIGCIIHGPLVAHNMRSFVIRRAAFNLYV